MEAIFELTYQDVKNIYLDSFYLLPTSHKSRVIDSIIYPLILSLILIVISDFSFIAILFVYVIFGLFTYMFFSKWTASLIGIIALWRNRNNFPKKYSVLLADDFLEYKNLQSSKGNIKIPWESIEFFKEKEAFLLLYIPSLNKVTVLKKKTTLDSPTSDTSYQLFLSQKLENCERK